MMLTSTLCRAPAILVGVLVSCVYGQFVMRQSSSSSSSGGPWRTVFSSSNTNTEGDSFPHSRSFVREGTVFSSSGNMGGGPVYPSSGNMGGGPVYSSSGNMGGGPVYSGNGNMGGGPVYSSTNTRGGTVSSGNSGTNRNTNPSASRTRAVITRLSSSSDLSTDEDPLNGIRVVCIFNNKHYFWQSFTPSMIEPTLCTHINYEFAILDPKTYEMIMGEPDLDMEFYEAVIKLKEKNPKLKVLLSIGGWDDSTKKYSDMVAVKSRRDRFIKGAVDFLKKHEFDGLDVAWEYPNCWQGAIGIQPADKENFSCLIKELKEAFSAENLLLTASVGAIKREMDAAYDIPTLSENVDYLNVMTYDLHGPWEPKTGHHTQFNPKPGDEDPECNVKSALNIWESKGANRTKLNLGLAMYAKTFKLENPSKNGIGAPAKGVGMGSECHEGGFILYNELCKLVNDGNCSEVEDKPVGFYAICGDNWAAYDAPMMVVQKAKYVFESGLGGVLIKDISGDDYDTKNNCHGMSFPLTRMARMEIEQKVRRLRRRQQAQARAAN